MPACNDSCAVAHASSLHELQVTKPTQRRMNGDNENILPTAHSSNSFATASTLEHILVEQALVRC